MSDYKYMVEYAHLNDQVAEDHPLHHGRGQMEITVERPILSQADKDEVAKAVFRQLNANDTVVTTIAIAKIEPMAEAGQVYIDYDPASQLTEETRRLLNEHVPTEEEDTPVYDITSLDKP